MTLFHSAYGEAGPPLVILHGLLGASGNWHTLSSKVFAERFRVFALDLRNHGRSPHDDVFTLEAMAVDVASFIEAHGLAPAHVLGHSMGGKVAMELALGRPDLVDRLVVADIAPKSYPPHPDRIFSALRGLDLDAFDGRGAIDAALAASIPERGVRQFLLKNLQLDDGRYSWKMNLEAIYQSYAHLNVAQEADQPFEGPTRFIRGAASDYVQDADLALIRTLFPHADLVTIPGAGHWVHAEAPEPFAEAVMTFLE